MTSEYLDYIAADRDFAAQLAALTERVGHRSGPGARTWVTNERDWSSIVDIVDSTYREILA